LFYQVVRPLGRKSVNKYLYVFGDRSVCTFVVFYHFSVKLISVILQD